MSGHVYSIIKKHNLNVKSPDCTSVDYKFKYLCTNAKRTVFTKEQKKNGGGQQDC